MRAAATWMPCIYSELRPPWTRVQRPVPNAAFNVKRGKTVSQIAEMYLAKHEIINVTNAPAIILGRKREYFWMTRTFNYTHGVIAPGFLNNMVRTCYIYLTSLEYSERQHK